MAPLDLRQSARRSLHHELLQIRRIAADDPRQLREAHAALARFLPEALAGVRCAPAPVQRGQIVDRAQSAQIDKADRDRLAQRLKQSSPASQRRSYIPQLATRTDPPSRPPSGWPNSGNARTVG